MEKSTYVRILRNAVIFNSFRILTFLLGFCELEYSLTFIIDMLKETYTASKKRVYNIKMNSIDSFVFRNGLKSFIMSECEFQCKRC